MAYVLYCGMTNRAKKAAYMREYTRQNADKINPRRQARRKERRAEGTMPRRHSTTGPCGGCGADDRNPSGSCRPCARAGAKRRKDANPDKVRADAVERGRRHRARMSVDIRKIRNRKYNLIRALRDFGLTSEQYDRMYAEQEGRCGICRNEPKGTHRLHIDHDHDTNIVRALLCSKCNTAIGLMDENTELLAAASRYLEHHRKGKMEMSFTVTSAA